MTQLSESIRTLSSAPVDWSAGPFGAFLLLGVVATIVLGYAAWEVRNVG